MSICSANAWDRRRQLYRERLSLHNTNYARIVILLYVTADYSKNFKLQFEYGSADRAISYNAVMVVFRSTARTQTSTWN